MRRISLPLLALAACVIAVAAAAPASAGDTIPTPGPDRGMFADVDRGSENVPVRLPRDNRAPEGGRGTVISDRSEARGGFLGWWFQTLRQRLAVRAFLR
jgi:hypothetical protein